MRRIDAPRLDYPFAGSRMLKGRMLKGLLQAEGHSVGFTSRR
jgi:hypothetical protein